MAVSESRLSELNDLPKFTLTDQQSCALREVRAFLDSNVDVFILKGAAGTGKTTILKSIIDQIAENRSYILSAPTGRAAMIIGSKTGRRARTMHSTIYTPERVDGGGVRLIRKINTNSTPTLFIVDEASMVSNQVHKGDNFFVEEPLLKDFLDFVKQGNPDNKVLFVGDVFQLPPVGESNSPALNKNYLESNFGLRCFDFSLTEVLRQKENSAVLGLATELRNELVKGNSFGQVSIPREYSSTRAMNRYLMEFDINSLSNSMIVCGSNRDVDFWNQWMRKEIGLFSDSLSIGDHIVNQVTWLSSKGEWIQKGQYGKVVALDSSIEEFAGLRFRDSEISFESESGKEITVRSKILLDSVFTRYGQLETNIERQLYAEVMRNNARFRTSNDISDDKYLGAMRIKHAYATTCHRAQGGEWDRVLVHPYLVEKDFRWTYTAITRARSEVFSYAA